MMLVLQNCPHDGPAFLGSWLDAQGLPWRLLEVWRDALPTTVAGVSGVAVLGGPMSANDDLPGLRATEVLIRRAHAANVPVLGHCLGGQLVAKAMGAKVRPNPVPEIGWWPIGFHNTALSAANGLGLMPEAVVYQWHHDTFELPPGASALASSSACAHQAFVVGSCLAMQFHIEVDAQKLARWRAHGAAELSRLAATPTVQGAEIQVQRESDALTRSQSMAANLYAHWAAKMAWASAR